MYLKILKNTWRNMRNVFSPKMRSVVTVAAVVIATTTLGVILNGEVIHDQPRPISMESSDNKTESSVANAMQITSSTSKQLGVDSLNKEAEAIEHKGEQMIKRADTIVAKIRPVFRQKDTASADAAIAQRINDIKARLGQSGR
jgi:hypothetical protein